MRYTVAVSLCGILVLASWSVRAQEQPKSESTSPPALDLLGQTPLRHIGPTAMSGRVTDLAVVESKPSTFYVASASGGVWKTVNNGITFECVFAGQPHASIGAVAVAPSNPEVVWVGTGEANARNSVSWGNGVFMSRDGGKSWQHCGLVESRHVGRIAVDPRDPLTAYVAAVGRFWGWNAERGLFKTTDGGKTWHHVLRLDDETGVIDVALDPKNPDVVYAAAYRVRRDAFGGGNPEIMFGPKAGIYKSSDGGRTWKRLTQGLPKAQMGRIGLTIYRRDPRILYAVVATEKTNIRQVAGQPPRANSDAETGGIFVSRDGGESWTKINDLCPRPFYFGQIRVDPNDDQRIYVLGIPLYVSQDGGKTFRSGAQRVHVDHHALWINPHNSDHLVLGNDGGVYISYDRGGHWEFLPNLPIAQFYAIGVDLRKPYWIYGGLQDNGSWGAPSASRDVRGILMTDWIRVGGGDGFYCQPDPADAMTLFVEMQYGRLQRVNLANGSVVSISPQAPKGQPPYRFNWNTPLLLSPHNPRIVYYGGNYLFRSVNRGDSWEIISPELTATARGSLTTIAESPRRAGILWTGSDDGRICLSRDGGRTWTDLTAKIPGLPPAGHVTRIEASPFDAATAFLSVDRHRQEDYRPYLYVTTDFGESWKPLHIGLPEEGPVHVVRQSPRHRDLLFVGTEFGLFVSLNAGQTWQAVKHLPPVAVHDLIVHPRDPELVIATHGRGIYILDIHALEQCTPDILAKPFWLFRPWPTTAYTPRLLQGLNGAKHFVGANPPYGATLAVYFRDTPSQPARLQIVDPLGEVIFEMNVPAKPGLHYLQWNLRRPGKPAKPGAPAFGPRVPAGDYVVRLRLADTTLSQKLRIEPDTSTDVIGLAAGAWEEEEMHQTEEDE
ncbi:Ycf48-like protein [bacterium HR36]|nr:Ycf48-like protein [bacterium HR36]